MVVTCPGCRSWFIVCAVHREADGRDLHCLNCGSRWPAPAGPFPAPGTAESSELLTSDVPDIGNHDPAVREAVAAIRDAVSSLCAQARETDRPRGRAPQLRSRDPAAIPA